MKCTLLGCALAVLMGAGLAGMPAEADAQDFTTGLAINQTVTMYSPNWCFASCVNMFYGTLTGGTAGGFGYWDLACQITHTDTWFAMIVFDYGTGEYEDVWYTYEDRL